MKTILVATDFNELATAALENAVQLAREQGASIVLLYADRFEPPTEFTVTQVASVKAAIDDSRRRTVEELRRYAAAHIPAEVHYDVVVRDELPVTAIVRTAEERNADLIAMGTHGRGGIARLLLGSVAEGVLRETNRPVITTKRSPNGRYVSGERPSRPHSPGVPPGE